MAPSKASATDADESLKRLGGGRWQTRDERFTIEPQSGTWAVVDAEETDDLGQPLVRGPFRSLTDAKAAIATARTSEAPSSPLKDRVERGREAVPAKPAKPARPSPREPEADETPDRVAMPKAVARTVAEPDEPPAEPSWFRDLDAADRGRARRLIDRLVANGVADAESIVRRDLAGGVPALAAQAITSRLAALPADASVDQVAQLLAEGRDDALGVRWRIVDGDGRPIVIERVAKARRR